jgi:amino acid adenylation domain-containing protein
LASSHPASPVVTVPDQIMAQARRSPDAVAVESGGDSLTYAQLAGQAYGLAGQLRRHGIGHGDLVAMAVPRGVDLVPVMLGVQLSGAAYVPLDPEHPCGRLNYILGDAGVRALITADASGSPGLRADLRIHLNDVPARHDPAGLPQLSADSTAYVIYTSGSTGRPKGVQVTHRALANFMQSMLEHPGLPAGVVLPAVTTVSFDIAALELFLPLTAGSRVMIARSPEASDPEQLMLLLARTGARVMQATPVTWRLLLEAGWFPPHGFTVLCGGERLPAELADWLLGTGVVLWDLYGPTETTIWSAVTRYERGVPPWFAPVRDTTLHVLDELLEPVSAGVAGELYIGGAGLAAGYLGRTALTAERFIADPFHSEGSRLYRTGDLARQHPDGRIEILGRSDDQIKVHGFRIEPGEIESALARHPAVAESAVRAIDGFGGDLRLVGYVRPASRAEPPESGQLRQHLARSLPVYMIPAQFVILDVFPRTQNGKLDRSALPAPPAISFPVPLPGAPAAEASGPARAESDRDAQTSTTERQVAEILAWVLERAEIGPHDDFFALGGDSLRAIQAILWLNSELNRQIPINALFEARTVYGLAMLLDADDAPEPELVPFTAARAPRLSAAQWRLWLHQQRAPDSVADSTPLAIRVPGPVDLGALETALTGLLTRHDILRTRYEYDHGGQPVPIVDPPAAVRLEFDAGDPESVLAADLARPFDLSREQPIRIRLVRQHDGSALLLLVVHAIAADGRSRELIAKQVRGAYRGLTISAPALRYADYAEWQREMAAAPGAQRHLAYWRSALTGLEQAELRTDRPRSISRDWRGGTVRFTVLPALADRLRDIAADNGTTVALSLLAGFFAALGQRTDGTDLTVGVPVSGRDRAEVQDMVGMFEQTAVIRVDVSGDPSFEQLLSRVRDSAVAACTHAVVPLEDITAAVLDVVAAEPAPGRNPLVDITFALHGIVAEPSGIALPAAEGAKLDMSCDLTERSDGGIDGRIGYATQLFDQETIDQFIADYLQLLARAGRDPARPLECVRAPSPA